MCSVICLYVTHLQTYHVCNKKKSTHFINIQIQNIISHAFHQEATSLHILNFVQQAYDIYCLSGRLSSEGLQLLDPNRLITHVRREVVIVNPDRAAEGLSNVPDYRGSLTRRHPSQWMMGRHLIANWLPSLKMQSLFGGVTTLYQVRNW